MRIQYIPYVWPLVVSAFISLSLGIYVILKRRNSKGALSFILSMFVVTIWSSGNALEMASVDLSTKLFGQMYSTLPIVILHLLYLQCAWSLPDMTD